MESSCADVDAAKRTGPLGAPLLRAERGPTLHAGERIAVLGANGAGKSTLLRRLAGVDRAARGEIAVADGEGWVSLAALPPEARARRIAWLPQTEEDADLTAAEAIAFGRAPWGEGAGGAVAAVAARLGIEELLARELRTLSGGERKKVGVARVLAQAAPIALLDEPFGPLDGAGTALVATRLAAHAAEGGVVVVVVHDPNIALEFATRAIVVAGGAIVADGPVEAVITEELLATHLGGGFVAARREDGALRFVAAPLRR